MSKRNLRLYKTFEAERIRLAIKHGGFSAAKCNCVPSSQRIAALRFYLFVFSCAVLAVLLGAGSMKV